MPYTISLSGKSFTFKDVKEVLAKANEVKSGDTLAGIAAESDLERIAAKEVLANLTVRTIRAIRPALLCSFGGGATGFFGSGFVRIISCFFRLLAAYFG